MPQPQPPVLRTMYQELRWMNGWIAAGVIFGFVLSLLEGAGFGVTSSPTAAIVEPILVWLGLILFSCARIVSHPYRAQAGTPAHDFNWNWFCACAVLLTATWMSFVASPALKAADYTGGAYLLGSLGFLALGVLVFWGIGVIIFNRAIKWSLAQAERFPAGRRMYVALAAFLAAQWGAQK